MSKPVQKPKKKKKTDKHPTKNYQKYRKNIKKLPNISKTVNNIGKPQKTNKNVEKLS